MIDQFDKTTFENAIDEIAAYYGLTVSNAYVKDNEYVYRLTIDGPVGIMVRSSVNPATGIADARGQDSIRLYLMDGDTWIGRIDSYTKREPGWKSRMMSKVYQLIDMYNRSGQCSCGRTLKIYRVTDKNKATYGKHFAKCDLNHAKGDGHVFVWLDK